MVHICGGEGLGRITSGHAKCHASVHKDHVVVMRHGHKEDMSVSSVVLMLGWGTGLYLA